MPDGAECTEIFNRVFVAHKRLKFRDRFDETEWLVRLLIAIYRQQVAGTRHADPISYARHLVQDQFRTPITLKEIARLCDVSSEHLVREFGRRYTETPGAMLRRLRLDYAREMLAVTVMPIGEIAIACGFASSNAFCRAFRARFGQAPGKSRS
jgi:transcriptional regulator GlxA family with amidase domain